MTLWKNRCTALLLGLGWCLALSHATAQTPVGFKQVRLEDAQGTGRPLDVALWYPALPEACPPEQVKQVGGNRIFEGVDVCADAPAPAGTRTAVLLSHGLFGHWGSQAWLAHALARRGHVVAAPNHPGTTLRDRRPEQMRALWLRPNDLTRVLDALIVHPEWAGPVVPGQAAVIGHSLGGWTALSMAGGIFSTARFTTDCAQQPAGYASCAVWRLSGIEQHPDHARLLDGSHGDPRIAAAVLLDTGLARGFTATSLAALKTPVLIVAAGQPDPVQPQEKESRVAFERLPPSTTEYRLHAGASHFSYLGSCRPDATALLAQGAPEERLVCLDGPGQDRTSLHRQTVEDVGGFLTRHLSVR